jgi:hypothetical protein
MNKFLIFSLVATLAFSACGGVEVEVSDTGSETVVASDSIYPSELSFLEGVDSIPADTKYVFTIDADDYAEMLEEDANLSGSMVFDEVLSIGEETVTLADNGEIPMGLVIAIPSTGEDALFVRGMGSFDAMVAIYDGVTLDFFASEVGMPDEGMYIPLTGEMKAGESVSADEEFGTLGQCNAGQCWVWGFADGIDVYSENSIDVVTPVDPTTLEAGDLVQGVVIGDFDEVEVVSVEGGVVTVEYEWAGELKQDELTADEIML